jgi:hypothetical protein
MPIDSTRAASLILALLWASGCGAFQDRPKLGPEAVPLGAGLAYLRGAPAPDYWGLAQFYVPQATGSACALASLAMALNQLRGLPPGSQDRLVTQGQLLEALAGTGVPELVAEGGAGVRFAELVRSAELALAAVGLKSARIETWRPADDGPETLARLRALLAANERQGSDVALAYFNQGVLTGDWDGPHVSPIGAYDQGTGRVLILDVDRDWYVPYWASDAALLKAMRRPAPDGHGPLAGETGGILWIRLAPGP